MTSVLPTPSATKSAEAVPAFPQAMMRASSKELSDVVLNVVQGEIPSDLRGHLFIIAPVGSVESNGLPNPTGTHIWNGNGMVYRVDFDQPGQARLTTRLMKTPCYYADLATQPGTPYEQYRFRDVGMARFSLTLGMRDALNTALIPMKFSADEPDRLLVTFDGGRPYELDPVTLKLITPVGTNAEWQPGLKSKFPFPPVLGSAHPAFDAQTQELFMVNYGRSLANFMATIPALYELEELPAAIAKFLTAIATLIHAQAWLQVFLGGVTTLCQGLFRAVQRLIAKLFGIADFVVLMRWNGSDACDRWNLLLPDGSPVRIEQTMHQIGVTQDYVILADTSLKFGLEQILNNPIPRSQSLERILRALLTRPQSPMTALYLIKRDQLTDGAPQPGQTKTAVAQKVVIPLETGHFLVDYDNPGDQVTLHMAHECATDVSEWMRAYDRSAYKPHAKLSPQLEGMISVGAMDVGRLGRYVIDARQGTVVSSQILSDTHRLWGIGLYAYPSSTRQQPVPLRQIYWQSLGFWPELMPQFIANLYQGYPHRLVPVADVLAGNAISRPSCLIRVDTATMTIADAFPRLPLAQDATVESVVINSPQFIPKTAISRQDDSNSTDLTELEGYILCTVTSQAQKALWIFDAQNLAQGPLCKLSYPDFDFGYTVHTTWLPAIASRQAGYCIPVRDDYQALVEQNSPDIQTLFEQDIYPHF
jgi:carotenoid cleavage dioxygenase-like enzyme